MSRSQITWGHDQARRSSGITVHIDQIDRIDQASD